MLELCCEPAQPIRELSLQRPHLVPLGRAGDFVGAKPVTGFRWIGSQVVRLPAVCSGVVDDLPLWRPQAHSAAVASIRESRTADGIGVLPGH